MTDIEDFVTEVRAEYAELIEEGVLEIDDENYKLSILFTINKDETLPSRIARKFGLTSGITDAKAQEIDKQIQILAEDEYGLGRLNHSDNNFSRKFLIERS